MIRGSLGFNPGKNGEFGSFTSVSLGGIVTQGLDTIYVNSINGNQKERHVDVVLRTIVHELLHESRIVDQKADSQLSLLMDLAKKPEDINWNDGLTSVRSALEHVIVSVAVAAFAEKNKVEAFSPGSSFGLTGKTISEYKTDLYNALNGSGVPRAATDATIAQPLEISAGSKNVETNVFKILENEKGGVAAYINEQGELVTTAKGSYYTENMLNLYGKEKVDSDGNVTASMTLGGTLRALADWLGFDGEFGIQGGFAKDNEGSDKEPVDAAKPVVLDMDGDGIEVSLDYANRDMDIGARAI